MAQNTDRTEKKRYTTDDTEKTSVPSVIKKSSVPSVVPRLAQLYTNEIVPVLQKRFGYTNRLAVPRLTKIVINVGCGEAAHDAKVLEETQRDVALITGQRPIITRAKKAISNFKIKEGDPVGCKVSVRRHRMYELLERLIVMVLPRVRDFRGLSLKGFDQGGNYSFGIQDKTIFPELRLDDVHYTVGMDVTLVTTAPTAQEARALLEAYGLPLEKGK